MTRRRQHILSLILIVALMASQAVADARSDAAEAQRRLDNAECRVRDLANAIAQAQCAVDAASARRSNALAAANSAQQQVIASSSAINDMNARINAYAQTARQAAELSVQRRADYDAAKQRLDSAAKAVDKYRADATATFESSPALKLSNDELNAASQGYQSAYDAALNWLRGTDDYAELYYGLEDMGAEVQYQRDLPKPNPGVLAAASGEWIESINALSKFRDDYLSRDFSLTAAHQRLQIAQAGQKNLVDRFNRDLAADNELKRLMDAVAGEQTNLASAAKEINAADASRASAEATITQLQAAIATEQARLDAAQRDLASLAGASDSTWYDLSAAQNELSRLCILHEVARYDYQQAAADLRRRIELADSEHARREIEAHSGDHLPRETSGRPTIAVDGVKGRIENHIDTERRARDDADARDRQRRQIFDRQRQADASTYEKARPAETTVSDDQQRTARGEEAVARRQALDAQRNAPAQPAAAHQARDAKQVVAVSPQPHPVIPSNDDRTARDRAARDAHLEQQKQTTDSRPQPRILPDPPPAPARDRDTPKQSPHVQPDPPPRDTRAEADKAAKEQADRDAQARAEQQRHAEQSKQQEQQKQEQQRQEQQKQEQQRRDEDNRRDAQRQEQQKQEHQRQEQQKQEQQRHDEDNKREAQRQEQQKQQDQQHHDQEQRDQDHRKSDDEAKARQDAQQREQDHGSKFRGK